MKATYLASIACAATFVAAAPALQSMKLSERQTTEECFQMVYIDIMLDVINVHRANHSVDDLVWNQTLATAAQYTVENGEVNVHDK
jgi:uncharacterized protein YkwD